MNTFRRFGGFSDITPVVKNILSINIILFVITYLMPELYDLLEMHYPTNTSFKPWQLVTHMFMHGSISHIIFNMFALYSFGSILERVLGARRFLKLYFLSGFGAIGLHLLVEIYSVYAITGGINLQPEMFLTALGKRQYYMSGEITNELLQYVTNIKLASIYISGLVGASGAIYGLTAAFTYLFPNTELMLMFIPVPIKAKYLVPFILIVYDLGYGTIVGKDNIAHFAHIGGAIVGFLIIYYWNKTNKRTFY